MELSMLSMFDLVGTIAFAISGAIVAIRHKMDLFGVNALAICTATGGGMLRDILIGQTPPWMFQNPFYVAVSALTANIVFLLMYYHRKLSGRAEAMYDRTLFWFDTLGLAAFTVDGVMTGIDAGFGTNLFLIVFLGFMTGVGGGALRDVLANQMPDIFRKHVYALSVIAGALVMAFLFRMTGRTRGAMTAGFSTVILLRCLAAHYRWNLPRVDIGE